MTLNNYHMFKEEYTRYASSIPSSGDLECIFTLIHNCTLKLINMQWSVHEIIVYWNSYNYW